MLLFWRLKRSVSSSQSYREAQTTALRLDPRTRTQQLQEISVASLDQSLRRLMLKVKVVAFETTGCVGKRRTD